MIIRAGLALILSIGLTACFNDVLNTKPEVAGLKGAADVQTLTNPNSGTKVNLRTGGKVVLKLDANPTTGYFWVLTQVPDQKIVQNGKLEYVADPAPPGLVGSGGTMVLELEAMGKGKTELGLAYQRSKSDVVETLNLQLHVE